jgi:multiple sugar transport system permease protein
MSSITPGMSQPAPTPYRAPIARRWFAGPVLQYALLVLLTIIFLIPFYVMFRNALMTQAQMTSFDWIWLPIPPVFQNLNDLLNDPSAPMLNGLKNSAIIAVLQTLGQMLIASLAGYGLARIPFRWSNLVFYFILVTLMIPSAVTFIPTYVIVARLGWVNTLQGVIVPGLFNVFATFLFRQFYLDFPKELEEAGRVDGLSYLGIYRYLVLPNSVGILVSLGAISFLASWNAFLWPLVIGQESSSWTAQVVLSTFLTAQVINLPALFMGAVLTILPPLILFFFLQRYIVEGVKLSGIKG